MTSSTVVVERFATPAAFLAAAGPTLQQTEIENALILGVASDLAEAASRGEPATDPYFACARERDRILICAFRSLPNKVGVTHAFDPSAIEVLAEDVRQACPMIHQIVGPEPTIGPFVRNVARLLGVSMRVHRKSRLHALRAVRPLENAPPGGLRPARESDLELLARWIEGFLSDVHEDGDPVSIASRRIRDGKLFVWEDGTPVSIAAASGKTPTGIRVNLVYTPPELRGRGYATSCVAALSRLLLDSGNEYCCLHTDLANPTANRIYRRIGYEPVCDATVYAFVT